MPVVNAAAATVAGGGIGELGKDAGEGQVDVAVPSTQDKRQDARPGKPAHFLPLQDAAEKFYSNTTVQVMVAVLIAANFATNMLEKQIDPKGTNYSDIFKAFDLGYNIAFTLELMINMYAHGIVTKAFWSSSWNVFDVVVVMIGIVNMLKLPLPKAFSLLRMMRAFRIFRLFKRVKSLNKIIVAIVHAVPGVMNAFLILTIIMCIYAILAVDFYKDVGRGCGSFGKDRMGFDTRRGYCMGNEYFGTFSKSLYTFFQVLTGESWCENVARPVIWFYQDNMLSVGSAMFFVSFVLVGSFVLTNVVVAVLLDKMVEQEPAEEEPEAVAAVEDAPPVAGPTPVASVPAADAPMSEDDKKVAQQLGKLGHVLRELATDGATIDNDFKRAKADMAEMREQIGLLVKAVERKYRLAYL